MHSLKKIVSAAALLLPLLCLAENPTPELLSARIAARLGDVAELRILAEEARARGLQVYLFGGSAAGFAHFVREELVTGRPANYEFTEIFRSTQDVDLVVDEREAVGRTHDGGIAEDVQKFQAWLSERFPYHLGAERGQWEVRPLREKLGGKDALLANADFLDQHNDSLSTGLIDLTGRDRVIRDLRAWEAETPPFLEDVAAGVIHYHHSPRHETTSRFRMGMNPPILSVVRLLTKAFQFGLVIPEPDLARLKAEIEAFEPRTIRDYPLRWLESNGPKLFRHASDLSRAWNTVERLGLRAKLMALSDPKQPGSLGWWMAKEPLRGSTDPLKLPPRGQAGRTAAELGIGNVTHETRDYAAYEAILRSPTGRPNVFISRDKHPGETAANGDGFYTRAGDKGGARTGFHIRFAVDANAREGVDFFLPPGTDHVLWLTRDKLRLLSNSPDPDPGEMLRFILDSRNRDERGIASTLLRRLARVWGDPAVRAALIDSLNAAVSDRWTHGAFIAHILPHPLFLSLPEWRDWATRVLETALQTSETLPRDLLGQLLGQKNFIQSPHWEWLAEKLLEAGSTPHAFLTYGLDSDTAIAHPAWARVMRKLLETFRDYPEPFIEFVLSRPKAIQHPDWGSLIELGIVSAVYPRMEHATFYHDPVARSHPRFGVWEHALTLPPGRRAAFLEAHPPGQEGEYAMPLSCRSLLGRVGAKLGLIR